MVFDRVRNRVGFSSDVSFFGLHLETRSFPPRMKIWSLCRSPIKYLLRYPVQSQRQGDIAKLSAPPLPLQPGVFRANSKCWGRFAWWSAQLNIQNTGRAPRHDFGQRMNYCKWGALHAPKAWQYGHSMMSLVLINWKYVTGSSSGAASISVYGSLMLAIVSLAMFVMYV